MKFKVKIKTLERVIRSQKQFVEDHEKQIASNAAQAKIIHEEMMSPDEYLQNNLNDYFIHYLPKDVISGDYYWARQCDDGMVLAIADATRTGNNGAMSSIVGWARLNDIVIGKKITRPNQILDSFRKTFSSSVDQESVDGTPVDEMNLSICRIDFKNMVMECACEKNPIYLVRRKKLHAFSHEVILGDEKYGENNPYKNHFVGLIPGDCVYLFTNGIIDQVGGKNGGVFGFGQLEDVLIKNSHLPMSEQLLCLNYATSHWKFKASQNDDILVFGIKF